MHFISVFHSSYHYRYVLSLLRNGNVFSSSPRRSNNLSCCCNCEIPFGKWTRALFEGGSHLGTPDLNNWENAILDQGERLKKYSRRILTKTIPRAKCLELNTSTRTEYQATIIPIRCTCLELSLLVQESQQVLLIATLHLVSAVLNVLLWLWCPLPKRQRKEIRTKEHLHCNYEHRKSDSDNSTAKLIPLYPLL